MTPARLVLVGGLLLFFRRSYFSLRPDFALASIGVGIAVFAIWVAPDLLFGYRNHWLFDNFLTGRAVSSIPPGLRGNAAFLSIRAVNCVLLVPVLEEFFWRGWLMRWLIDRNFVSVPLGKYVPSAFWIVALLFASEHGPYWEVGLAAGIVYNWWIVRTRNLADCMLAHAVTNGLLSAYVLIGNQWQYWL
jgi:CAAX prenyl protease-like protein